MKTNKDKIEKLDMLNNTLTTKQKQLLSEILEVTPSSDLEMKILKRINDNLI